LLANRSFGRGNDMNRSRGCAAVAAFIAAIAPPAAWAQTPARPGTACFHVKQMQHLRADGPRTLYARMGKGVLRLDLANDCPDVAVYGGALVLRPAPSGLVCGPMDINIDLKNHGGTRRCIVSDLTQLTAGEVAALPRAARP